jgi:cytochrome c-type biogenesis protein
VADPLALALGYAAGALSTLSPCVLPLLPIVLFGAIEKHAWGPVALAAGLSVSFAVVGVSVSLFGFGLGLDASTVRVVVAVLMIAAGATLLLPRMQAGLAVAAGPIMNGGQSIADRIQPSGLRGQFLLGAALGAVWSPCSGPTLGAAIGLAAQGGTAASAAAVMAMFGLGAATPILALAYGSRQAVMARRDRLMTFSRIAKPIMAATLIAVGALVLTGLDKRIETALTNAMPEWLVALTTRF